VRTDVARVGGSVRGRIGLQALAAIAHHVVFKDRTLRRII
jgi:cytochrome b561